MMISRKYKHLGIFNYVTLVSLLKGCGCIYELPVCVVTLFKFDYKLPKTRKWALIRRLAFSTKNRRACSSSFKGEVVSFSV